MVSLRFLLCFLFVSSVYATIVSHDGRAITIDGHRRVLLSGSIHYPRSTPEMWPDLIKKGKEGGLDAIETYVFWNAHEPTRRQYDFSGKLDLIRFLKTIQNEGLYVVLRIGPYACAEWNYGGFPVWLHNMPGMVFRTTNKAYMDEMQNFTTMIVDMVKKEKLFASQGGPIILAQIENEYGNVMGPYGESGKAYIKWCANMAQSLDVGVPWIMCQQNDAPKPMLNTCNGFYCDNFVPNNPNTPKMWTENWTGWFKQWGGKNPHRTTEDELLIIIICSVYATIVSHDGRAITIDGHRRVLLSGSIHYPRSTPEMWPDLIKKSKEGGLDAIETYVFWNAHEPTRRQYDFSGKLDLIRFLKTIQNEGLYAVLRIGPYACAEWNYGGFPVWLHNMPGMVFRTTNKAYMDEMQNFTTMIVDMVKKEKLFASQGGPIILAQIENEYGNVMGPYGESGKAYIKWCANMAQSLDVGVPWIMCQQNDAPQPMLNTCNGFYCDNFVPNNPNTPKMWTENWTGWFKQWGGKNPHRTTEDVAFSVARFFQRGGTFNNYYMYHGGTNFDRTAGGPYITTSYDYDAPLDEYGNLSQPKYGHLKQLHDVLHSIEKTLTYGNISTIDFGNSASATIYKTEEGSSCFFGNGNENSDATISFQGESYVVPAWSVTILPDCKNEAYNTAKITTQTSMMVKKPNEAEDTPSTLKWSWRPENMDNFLLKGKGESTQTQLFDQKVVTNDQSDYLWYMTTVKFKKRDPFVGKTMSLRINSTAHVLHAFVNGKNIGNQHAENGKFNYVFEKDVKFKSGRNVIALLSITVGLANYGAFFESKPAGITGPIFITGINGDETIVKDLSAHKWSYKTGLNGFDNQLFRTEAMSKWSVENVPFNRTMTWYKATFKSPLGNDPVVVDLMGLGKGTAWVNGNNIGRYWPAFISSENGCDAKCNYRGAYHAEKCLTNCGEPTQRWYHVPRSFLNAKGDNTLVLFEEMGGNPSLVSFQTTRVGSVCANVYEKTIIELSCDRKPISAIKFASFGNPDGNCGSFEKGTCESSKNTADILTQECVGKEKCSIDVSTEKFGAPDCSGAPRRLAVEAIC
uniref:Beta-galactosidase n=1 Tax=Brassica campestris TaxID=3711 RepID=A0A3P6B8U3_BRACM|nr:unnamed protein product [Brassica rapa]